MWLMLHLLRIRLPLLTGQGPLPEGTLVPDSAFLCYHPFSYTSLWCDQSLEYLTSQKAQSFKSSSPRPL